MKIRINRERRRKETQTRGNILDKRIKLPKNIRLAGLVILALALIFSAVFAYAAYQKTDTTQRSVPVLSYTQSGSYDYTVYLKNNTVYEGKASIKPYDNLKIFKNLVDSINASFTYVFNIDTSAKISIGYTLSAQIKTDDWTKTYTLIPLKQVTVTGTRCSFTENFVIDYEFYENITSKIQTETGITPVNPSVVFQFNVMLTATTGQYTVTDSLSPSISYPQGGKTIDFSQPLSTQSMGSKTIKQDAFNQDVVNERSSWRNNSLIFLALLIIVVAITRSKTVKPTKIEKTVNKIMKKYGEWIVDVDKPPRRIPGSDIVYCKTIDDLMKISEELGKPVIHNELEKDVHSFHVLDGTIQYQYVLSDSGKMSKTVICPDCKTAIETEGMHGESVQFTCPNCGRKGETRI